VDRDPQTPWALALAQAVVVFFTNFQDALWFAAAAPGQGRQLYKLGNDGSVTKWTALSTGQPMGLDPLVPFVFNDAVWFNGNTASGRQLFKLGNDGSVT